MKQMLRRIVALAGRTSCEFTFYLEKPVANRIIWYLMVSDSDHVIANKTQGIVEAKFFPINEALEKVTYSQDKSLLTLAIQKLKEINEEIE